ncbi:MAG: DNA alkylation repair protein [Gammaproteobacteria bacterium]
MKATEIQKIIRALADPERAKKSQRFFKTGKGEYAEGDQFLGITNPVLRSHAAKFAETSITQTLKLLKSVYHEERLLALFILVKRFGKADEKEQETIFKKYLANLKHINNWDLVDSSAYQIVGRYLHTRNRSPLYTLAKSPSLWARRIAVVSTYHFIKNGDFKDVLKLSRLLINDKEDLIHKAVGWMLREAGNRSRQTETSFLKKYYVDMPRTMLRYAIEKYPEKERQKFLKGLF